MIPGRKPYLQFSLLGLAMAVLLTIAPESAYAQFISRASRPSSSVGSGVTGPSERGAGYQMEAYYGRSAINNSGRSMGRSQARSPHPGAGGIQFQNRSRSSLPRSRSGGAGAIGLTNPYAGTQSISRGAYGRRITSGTGLRTYRPLSYRRNAITLAAMQAAQHPVPQLRKFRNIATDRLLRKIRTAPVPLDGMGGAAAAPAPGESEDDKLLAASGLSLAEVMEIQAMAQRAEIVDRGWKHMRAGEYLEAWDQFDLAEHIDVRDPAASAELQWGKFFAALSSERYELAEYQLRRLVQPVETSPGVSNFPDPHCMEHLAQLDLTSPEGGAQAYDGKRFLQRMVMQLETEAGRVREQEGLAPQFTAMRAVALWASGEDSHKEARDIADRLARDYQEWEGLSKLMERGQ